MAATIFGRVFNEARKAQGFKSQADLDAFYAYHDHCQGCAECRKPGAGVMLDDGMQPTENRCGEALRLQAAWFNGREA